MRLTLRFIVPLVVALTIIAYAVVPLVDRLTLRWFARDMDMRSTLIANTIHDSIQDSLISGSKTKTLTVFNKILQDERLYALGFCSASGGAPLATRTFPSEIRCAGLGRVEDSSLKLLPSDKGALHVARAGIDADGSRLG